MGLTQRSAAHATPGQTLAQSPTMTSIKIPCVCVRACVRVRARVCACACSVVSDLPYRLQPTRLHGILQARILECHFLLQGIFPTQGSKLCLLPWQAGSLPLEPSGKAYIYIYIYICIHTHMYRM